MILRHVQEPQSLMGGRIKTKKHGLKSYFGHNDSRLANNQKIILSPGPLWHQSSWNSSNQWADVRCKLRHRLWRSEYRPKKRFPSAITLGCPGTIEAKDS